MSLKENPYESPKFSIFEKIRTKVDFKKNPYLYGQILTSGNTVDKS